MGDQIIVRAQFRSGVGKAASRRLRRREEQTPGILYGGGGEPVPLAIAQRDLAKAMQEEAFFSQILALQVGEKTQACVLREVQRHPATDQVQHVDFLRIREDLPVQMRVPLHFVGEAECVGVKLSGGRLAHNLMEVEVSCLPRHLPEFIEVDVATLQLGQSLHLSDLVLPEGVSLVALALGRDHDTPVIGVTARRGGADPEPEAAGDDEPAAAPDAES